ncbi:MAG: hypothetical protein ACI85I_001315 [Arenicella sp.]|jgi:hypothetical protein
MDLETKRIQIAKQLPKIGGTRLTTLTLRVWASFGDTDSCLPMNKLRNPTKNSFLLHKNELFTVNRVFFEES